MNSISCPGCSANLKIRDDKRGKNVRCPKCGNRFLSPEDDTELDDFLLVDLSSEELAMPFEEVAPAEVILKATGRKPESAKKAKAAKPTSTAKDPPGTTLKADLSICAGIAIGLCAALNILVFHLDLGGACLLSVLGAFIGIVIAKLLAVRWIRFLFAWILILVGIFGVVSGVGYALMRQVENDSIRKEADARHASVSGLGWGYVPATIYSAAGGLMLAAGWRFRKARPQISKTHS